VINPKIFIVKEWQFFKKLSHEAQMLTLSFGMYSLADPILWTFVNAFLWRETNNIILVALYNLFLFAGLPIGFLINGLILKRFKATEFLMFASIVQGLVIFVLMFRHNLSTPFKKIIQIEIALFNGFMLILSGQKINTVFYKYHDVSL
jgi:YQGE family putative transporter